MNQRSKEEIQELSLTTRAWEAACKIEHPTADELNFRIALAKKLGLSLGLRELRNLKIEGPVKG